jgi:hypothetical protein
VWVVRRKGEGGIKAVHDVCVLHRAVLERFLNVCQMRVILLLAMVTMAMAWTESMPCAVQRLHREGEVEVERLLTQYYTYPHERGCYYTFHECQDAAHVYKDGSFTDRVSECLDRHLLSTCVELSDVYRQKYLLANTLSGRILAEARRTGICKQHHGTASTEAEAAATFDCLCELTKI